ncbi:MAG TPA: LytTR family DNA-binding domain-containing protein [Opitutus sp.]|nr:LytTR family DNA-binding domain-containing protein [Opitutus sp.]
MIKLRTVTVDDEPVALRRLSRLLARADDVEIVAACKDGPAAVQAVREHKPDVLFLDVQMPGMNGFEVLQALKGDRRPFVIFVTAFDEYALRAFDAQALDYVLKPFGEARVEQALARARTCVRGEAAGGEQWERIAGFLGAAGRQAGPSCLFIKRDDRVLVLQPGEIDWIESDGDYVRIHAANATHFTRMKLTEIERRLAREGFVRIHRSRLVNLAHVAEFRALSRGASVVVMKSGARLDASYACLRQVQDAADRPGPPT